MQASFRSILRHILYELRGGFLLIPGLTLISMAILGIVMVWLEAHVGSIIAWESQSTWTVPRDPAVAQSVLSAIVGSIMTVLSVVYSVLLLVLTFASMQFSPRIIVSFMRDRVTQYTLGSFLGTFTFCLIVLPSIHGGATPFVPTISVSLGMLFAFTSVLFLVYFVHNMAISIQATSIVDGIANETVAEIRFLFGPNPKKITNFIMPTLEEGLRISSPISGYLQYVNLN